MPLFLKKARTASFELFGSASLVYTFMINDAFAGPGSQGSFLYLLVDVTIRSRRMAVYTSAKKAGSTSYGYCSAAGVSASEVAVLGVQRD